MEPYAPFEARALSSLRRRRSLVRVATPSVSRRATSLSPRRHSIRFAEPPRLPIDMAITREELCCSICFDLLCYPVTLPCGHNFDRGCLLTAWEHTPLSHACPLCRQRSALTHVDELHVNLLLKKLITAQFPIELDALARDATKRRFVSLPTTPISATDPSERRRYTWRTAASFLYVWLASITEPPGFVLAVLLLMSLLAIAVTPPQMLSTAPALPTVFDGMDHILNAFLLLVREIAARTDELDLAWPCMQVVAFIL